MAACVCQHSAPSAESSRFYRIFSSVHASVSGRIIGRNAQRLDATPTRISRAHVQSMRATDGASRSTTSKAVTSSVLDDQQVTMGDKLELKGMNIEELAGFCELLGERAPEKRAMQLWRWMYADVPTYGGKTYIHSLGETIGKQNGFSAAFCEAAGAHGKVGAGIELTEAYTAKDGTTKLVFHVTTGAAKGGRVETVLIPITRKRDQRQRITVCVSSQVGCAMNCQFCFTGRMGLRGNLTTAQIVEQIVEAKRFLSRSGGDPKAITNVVFMGMGEPMDNMEAVLRSLPILCHPKGLHLSKSRVTVSTVGIIPQMRAFVEAEPLAELAVSLHATTDQVRDWIVPVNRRYPMGELISCLEELYPITDKSRRTVLIEYVMLKGVNDSLADAERLCELLQRVRCKVNLIVFNPHEGTRFEPSQEDDVWAFRNVLASRGLVCTVRDSRGDDEMAACGQLGDPGSGTDRLLSAPEWAVQDRASVPGGSEQEV